MKIREVLIEAGFCPDCADNACEGVPKEELDVEFEPEAVEFLKTRWLPSQGLLRKHLN